MPESEKQPPDETSRSAIKREMLEIQKIGEALVKLPPSQLKKISLPDDLLEAIKLAHRLKSNEAKRRQLQFIGKLMRNIDVEPIRLALKQIQLSTTRVTDQFHKAEEWRERLIAEGDAAIQSFVSLHSKADRQVLRQLIRQAQLNRKSGKNTGAEKALFNYVNELIKLCSPDKNAF